MLRDICHFSRDGLVKKGVHKDAFHFIVLLCIVLF